MLSYYICEKSYVHIYDNLLNWSLFFNRIFNDYFFETSPLEKCKKFFYPSYALAIIQSPFDTNHWEYYMTVGLNSDLCASEFARLPLNLAIIIDVSGSMGSPFNAKHFRGSNIQSKLTIAKNLIMKIVDKLDERDRLAVITFNTKTIELQSLVHLSQSQKHDIKRSLIQLKAEGGTDMSAGINASSALFDRIELTSEYENRIIFLTDAQTNTGELNINFFKSQIQKNAERHIYTTFIGLGIDLQTSLIQEITNHRGANYFTVNDENNFSKLLDEDFNLIVTPLVFNLQLSLQSHQFDIEHVFGSPEYSESTKHFMKINTLFPSRTRDDGSSTRGGVILLKLKNKQDVSMEKSDLQLIMTYEDRVGNITTEKSSIDILGQILKVSKENECLHQSFYANSGIRKAILLVEYITLLKTWIRSERDLFYNKTPLVFCIKNEDNAWLYKSTRDRIATWERQNTPLKVSPLYRSIFTNFKTYFEQEMSELKDDDLNQELAILDKLISYNQ